MRRMALARDRFEVFWAEPASGDKKRFWLLAFADTIFGTPAAPGNALISIRERDGSEVARIENSASPAGDVYDLVARDLDRLSPEDFMAEWGIAPGRTTE
jgi:hypothetical protein